MLADFCSGMAFSTSLRCDLSLFQSVKAGFHMLATIATIAEKKKRLVNDRTEVYLSDRWRNALCNHYDVRSLKSGFHMIATIAERFFQRSQ